MKKYSDIIIVILICGGMLAYFQLRPGKKESTTILSHQSPYHTKEGKEEFRALVKELVFESLNEIEEKKSKERKKLLLKLKEANKTILPPITKIGIPGYYCNIDQTLVMEFIPKKSLKRGKINWYMNTNPFDLSKKDFLEKIEPTLGPPPQIMGDYHIVGSTIRINLEKGAKIIGGDTKEIKENKYVLDFSREQKSDGKKVIEFINLTDDGVKNEYCK